MNALGLLLVASWRRNRRRQLTVFAIAFVTASIPLAAVTVAANGTRDLANLSASSGALTYEVSAVDENGNPTPLQPLTLARLAEASNVRAIEFTAPVAEPVVGPLGTVARSSVTALAVGGSYLPDRGASSSTGVPSVKFGQVAVTGWDAARSLGLSEPCVANGACWVEIGDVRFLVVGILAHSSDAPSGAVFVDIETAAARGLTSGPLAATVTAEGLPASSVARALDAIATTSGQQIFVDAPVSASLLRVGITTMWRDTLMIGSLMILCLAVFAQVAVQFTTVRARQREILTLRALGCSSTRVLVQFCLEPALPAAAGVAAAVLLVWWATQLLSGARDVSIVVPGDRIFVLAAAAFGALLLSTFIGAGRVASIKPEESLAEA